MCVCLDVCVCVCLFLCLWHLPQGVGMTLGFFLGGVSRWYRVLLFLPFAVGITLLWMGSKGQ